MSLFYLFLMSLNFTLYQELTIYNYKYFTFYNVITVVGWFLGYNQNTSKRPIRGIKAAKGKTKVGE